MQMWTEGRSRWRKKGRRGVSPIIATILLVAITVVLAAVLYILISGLTKGPGNTPLGTALAMSSPQAGVNGTANIYTLGITPSSGLTASSLQFQVLSSAGAITVLPAGSTVTILGPQACLVALYTFSSNSWGNGPVTAANHCTPAGTTTTVLTSGMQFVLSTGATNLQGQGDSLNAIGVGSFSGSVPEALP